MDIMLHPQLAPQPKSKINTPSVSESNQGGTVAGSGHARLHQCDFIRGVMIGPQCAGPRALRFADRWLAMTFAIVWLFEN
jgi:hypothetical protein